MPISGCPVVFYNDFTELAQAGRALGEFCGLPVAVTDASGIATLSFTALQQDLDFCNCLPSNCNCFMPPFPCSGGTSVGLCPDPGRCSVVATCSTVPIGQDLFCQVAVRAISNGLQSSNYQVVEYGN